MTVFYDGTDNWLSDGFHRLYAARNAGFDEIDADVRQGTLKRRARPAATERSPKELKKHHLGGSIP